MVIKIGKFFAASQSFEKFVGNSQAFEEYTTVLKKKFYVSL